MTGEPGLLLQAATRAAPTVGDTIWIARTVRVPAGATLRAADWDAADPVERLGPPRLSSHGDSTEIGYPVVVWRAGPLVVDLPGPLLLSAGGRVDSLPPQSVSLTIASVLPSVPPDSTLTPQPRADFVPRAGASALPLLVLLAAAAVLLGPLHWWWRRRGRPRPRPDRSAAWAAPPPLERWADAGESRAVASAATRRLRALIADRVPAAHSGLDTEDLLRAVAVCADWPVAELGDVLRSLDEARFGDMHFPDAAGLARWAEELAGRLAPVSSQAPVSARA